MLHKWFRAELDHAIRQARRILADPRATMPNRLSKVRRKATLCFESDAITKRPDIAPLIAQIIANGSLVETMLIRLVASLLSSEQRSVAAMLQVIVNFRTKIELANAIVSEKFTKHEKEISISVFSYVQSVMTQRHKFAHHIIATCEELPKDILLVEPEAYVETFIKENDFIELQYRLHDKNRSNDPDFDRIWVYKKNEIEEIIKRQKLSIFRLRILDGFLTLRDPAFEPMRKSALDLLCKEPSIASAAYPEKRTDLEDAPPTPARKSRAKPRRSDR